MRIHSIISEIRNLVFTIKHNITKDRIGKLILITIGAGLGPALQSIENGKRQNISSDSKYEKQVGYSRAVRVGNLVFVSGTTGLTDSNWGVDSSIESYEQAKRTISKIADALNEANCSLEDVVSTRVFVSREADWKQIAKAHLESFEKILPASSMLVCEFLDPKILVEIEAQAAITT